MPPKLLTRYSEIGIVPAVYGQYPTCFTDYSPPPEEYRSWKWPWQALLDANPSLPVAWHGDNQRNAHGRPLDDFYSLVTRDRVGEDGAISPAQGWQKQHVVTIEEALPRMTIHSVYAPVRDDEIGSLAPGKYADLIVLSDNPLAVEPEEIPKIAVRMTMLDGKTVHCAAGHEGVCP